MSCRAEQGAVETSGIDIGDTEHDIRHAQKAGVISAIVKTGGQARKHLRKTQAQNPHHLLKSFVGLRQVI